MKKIKKRLDRIMNPLPRDEHDPIEVEYKIMCAAEKKTKNFIDEVTGLIPSVLGVEKSEVFRLLNLVCQSFSI